MQNIRATPPEATLLAQAGAHPADGPALPLQPDVSAASDPWATAGSPPATPA